MENNVQNNAQLGDEINLRELFDVVWAGKQKIIFITVIFAFISVIYSLSLPNQYRATALLAPAQSESSDLSGALGQLGGLASLAGVNIAGGESTESQIAQEIMRSWNFIEGFIAKNNIAVEVYAAQDWSRGSNELDIDADLYDSKNKTWLVENDTTGKVGPPSSWNLFQAFSSRLGISEDKKLGLVSVSIEYYSPQIAKRWLDMYVNAINSHMQQRQVEKVSNNISYLQVQIEKTSNTEMREIFYNIIEEQTKNKMVAEASPDYAFVVVSPSMLPEEKSQPQRALICILGTLFGGMISLFIVLLQHYGRKQV